MKRAFKTDEIFKNKFLEYIEYCEEKGKLPNVAGFCAYNDINRDTFYAQKELYSDTFKKIQDILEDATLNAKTGDTLKIFYLKNKFGYRDKVENVNVQTSYEEYLKRVDGDEY